VAKDDGRPVFTKVMKMSKSRYNVTNPDDMCVEHGADALRLYEVFMGPLEDGGMWDDAGVAGTRRFLDRTWRLVVDPYSGERPASLVDGSVNDADLDRALHAAVKRVSEAIGTLRFNTAISEMMIFVNTATKAKALGVDQMETFLRILAPFAPHIADELWQRLGNDERIDAGNWPVADEEKLKVNTVTLAVQIQGKMRGTVEVPADASKDACLAAAKADETIARHLAGKTIRREIVVPGRLINFVVG
jgi:leucyl-tRNA synthetase